MEKHSETIIRSDKDVAMYYIHVVSDTVREAFVILDDDLRVVVANSVFYKTFHTAKEQTENKLIYDLGNKQWDIPKLRELLENILPTKKVFYNFEVSHEFPEIGFKIMLLNARKLDATQQVVLAIEDITVRKELEKKLAEYTEGLEVKVAGRTKELNEKIAELERANKNMVGRELKMVELKKEIEKLKKNHKNGNGNHNGNHRNSNGKK